MTDDDFCVASANSRHFGGEFQMKISSCFLVFALAVFSVVTAASSNARADVTPPTNPVLTPSTGPLGGPPIIASPSYWELIEANILAMYPNADWGQILYLALTLYNALPPDYSQDPGNQPNPCLPPPPLCLPPLPPCP